MKEKIEKIVVWIIGVSFVLILLYVIDWEFLKSEITEYPVMCSQKLDFGICNGQKTPLNPRTYRVFPKRQEVIYFMKGFDLPVRRLTKCAVLDRRNWSCKYDDDSAELGFRNGEYWITSSISNDFDERTYYVSRFQWLKLQ